MSEQPGADGADGADGTAGADLTEPESYEQARAELEDVVRRLEAGGVPLEDSLVLWERGEALARHCEQWLDGARRRLERPPADDTA